MTTARWSMAVGGVVACAVGQVGLSAPLGLRVADALAGGVFVAAAVAVAGVDVAQLRRWSVLAFAAGVVWFVASVVPGLVVGWRVAMSAAVLAFPTGRPGNRAAWVAVVASAAVSVPVVGIRPVLVLACAALVATVASLPGVETQVRRIRGSAGVMLGMGMVWPLLAAWLWEQPLTSSVAAAYGNCLFVATAGALLWWGVVGPVGARRRRVDAMVVELDTSDPVLRALEDPSDLDPAGLAARRLALELLDKNHALQAALDRQVAAVGDSQRRLLETADVERGRLAARLEGDLRPLLGRLDRLLADAYEGEDNPTLKAMISSARDEVAGCRAGLAEVADGLHPEGLRSHGLAEALADLGRRAPLPVAVSVSVPTARCGDAQEAAVWFVCAEALSNIHKYACASRASVVVAADRGWLRVVVDDDGVGGADVVPGGGLAGLRDRLRALGGDLSVGSGTAGGTRLQGRLPCGP